MSKKKVGIIVGTVVVVAAVAAAAWWKFGGNIVHDSNDRVYVQRVSAIMGTNAGMQNRYAGIVQPQKTVDINADSERTIKEFYVKVGDTVEEGTPLFAYDTEELELELQQAKLEDENTNLEISGYKNQIAELEKERNAAPEEGKFEYTTQIQTLQTQIRQAEFDKSSKKLEVEKLQEKITNCEVASTTAGVIKTLNDPKVQNNTSENSDATISIMATGNYRIKGTLDEQTVNAVFPGSNVIIRSRVDENQTWRGTVDNVDTGETAKEDDENVYYSNEDSSNTASKYPFYISLEDTEGLILGQHVFIELDEGQTEVKEGLWLYGSYIVMGDGEPLEELSTESDTGADISGAYVWADDGNGKLIKKPVVLGEYDSMLDEYQIVSGITESDMIAWPMEGLYEGITVVTNMDDVDYSSGLYNTDNEMLDEEYDTEGLMEDWYDTESMMEDWDDTEAMFDGEMLEEGGLDADIMEEEAEVSQ